MKQAVDNYLNTVDPKLKRDNWTPYEKFAFIKGISIPDAVMIAAAQFEFGTDMSLVNAKLNTNDWLKDLRKNFISQMGRNQNSEDEVISAAWEVVHSYYGGEHQQGVAMQKLLSKDNEYKNKLSMIIKSEIVRDEALYNLDKPARYFDIDISDSVEKKEVYNNPEDLFEQKYKKLLESGDYYKFDIVSNQRIDVVGPFTLEFLQKNASGRYTEPFKDPYGEVIWACLSEKEILKISRIMNRDDNGLVSTDFDYNFSV
ncbi:hypothetical protein ABZM97_03435 [Bacillus vallismortis]|uniref:hypothetical protein n=1 Tax=Bacillus vallismortis TaxID=72361 RepID=UPI00345FC223